MAFSWYSPRLNQKALAADDQRLPCAMTGWLLVGWLAFGDSINLVPLVYSAL